MSAPFNYVSLRFIPSYSVTYNSISFRPVQLCSISLRLAQLAFRPIPSRSVSFPFSSHRVPLNSSRWTTSHSIQSHFVASHSTHYLGTELRKREIVAVVVVDHGQRVELAENGIPPACDSAQQKQTTPNQTKQYVRHSSRPTTTTRTKKHGRESTSSPAHHGRGSRVGEGGAGMTTSFFLGISRSVYYVGP